MNRYYSSNSKNSGLGFGDVLPIVFIVLKLAKVIDWSWWWVLSPTWISILILVVAWVWIKVS